MGPRRAEHLYDLTGDRNAPVKYGCSMVIARSWRTPVGRPPMLGPIAQVVRKLSLELILSSGSSTHNEIFDVLIIIFQFKLPWMIY